MFLTKTLPGGSLKDNIKTSTLAKKIKSVEWNTQTNAHSVLYIQMTLAHLGSEASI